MVIASGTPFRRPGEHVYRITAFLAASSSTACGDFTTTTLATVPSAPTVTSTTTLPSSCAATRYRGIVRVHGNAPWVHHHIRRGRRWRWRNDNWLGTQGRQVDDDPRPVPLSVGSRHRPSSRNLDAVR